MQFKTKNTACRRFTDCWAVSCAVQDGEHAGEMAAPRWFYATLGAAAHKMLELEVALQGRDETRDLRDAVKEIDAAYERVYASIYGAEAR